MVSTTPTVWKSIGKVNELDSTSAGNDQFASRTIALAGGGFLVAWVDNTEGLTNFEPNDVAGQLYDAYGNEVGHELLLSGLYADLDQKAVALGALASGGFLAAYQTTDAVPFNDGENTVVAIFNGIGTETHDDDFRQGLTQPPAHTIDDAAPSLATFAGGYILAYEQTDAGDTNIVFHIVTSPFTFPAPPPAFINADASAGNQISPHVALLSDSSTNPVFAITYNDVGTGSIRSLRADVTNGPGSAVTLSAGTANSDPEIAALAGGSFVVAWRDGNGDGAGNGGIEFRLVDKATGSAIGAGPVHVNTTVLGNQFDPAIAPLSDGGFAVVWTDADLGIRGQLFSSTGSKVGVEFSVAANGGGNIYSEAHITLLRDGRLEVSFTLTSSGNQDIYSTILDPRVGDVVGTAGGDLLFGHPTATTIAGLGGNDTLFGLNGADKLNGGLGADTMRGGGGNDTYYVDNAGDVVNDSGNDLADLVLSSISFSLTASARVIGVIENLTLLNVSTALGAYGNNANNIITGNNYANVFNGYGGSDKFIGGLGIDTETGGLGNDIFVFNAPVNVANRDVITDFHNVLGDNDTFQLENAYMTKLGAANHVLNPAFFYAGAAAHDANDYIVYNRANGYLSYDVNGNGTGGAMLIAVITNKPVLTYADFVVI